MKNNMKPNKNKPVSNYKTGENVIISAGSYEYEKDCAENKGYISGILKYLREDSKGTIVYKQYNDGINYFIVEIDSDKIVVNPVRIKKI